MTGDEKPGKWLMFSSVKNHAYTFFLFFANPLINISFINHSLSKTNNNLKLEIILKSEINPTKVLFATENPNTYKEQLLDIQLSFKHLKSLLVNFGNSLNFPELFRVTMPNFILGQIKNIFEILNSKEIQVPKVLFLNTFL